MATNTFQVLTFITREMLRQVKNNLQFVKNISGEDFGGRFTEAPKKGETISIRKQARYTGRSGEDFTEESYIERSVTMTVQTTSGVDILLTNRELMFQADDIAERVLAPAALTLAHQIDTTALQLATQATANYVGTPGTVPTTLKLYNQARARMSWEACPQDAQHTLLLTPDAQVEIVDSLKGLFHDASQVEKQYNSGMMGRAIGAKWYECQNIYQHTIGPLGGTPAVDGATQSGSTILTKNWTNAVASRLKKGDKITFAGVYGTNPWTRTTYGALREFTITSDFSSLIGGGGNISISPAMTLTGPYQNVTALPADGALISVWHAAAAAQAALAGTVTSNLLRFHKDAFLWSSFDQPKPEGAVEFSRLESDPQTGLKIRFIRDWDTRANKQINRFDVVWAFGVAFPEFACIIAS